jgi:hypothetical protein
LPGYAELSDGTVLAGNVYLTRDARLRIFDTVQNRFHEVPLTAVLRIETEVKREWMEEEWRFKENASDEKLKTGRSYPAREYEHSIRLVGGKTLKGTLSAIVYVETDGAKEPRKILLQQRAKGAMGASLKSLVVSRIVELGEKALETGLERQRRSTERARKLEPRKGNSSQPMRDRH